MAKPVWIGLVDIAPVKGNERLEGAAGAFVHLVAPANTADDFHREAESLFAHEGFAVKRIEDAEPFADRLRHGHVVGRIARLAERVVATQQASYDDRWNLYEG